MKSTINSHVRWKIMIVTAWRPIYFSPDTESTEWHFCLILLNYSVHVYVTLFFCDMKIYFLKVMFLTRCALCFCITVYFPACHSVFVFTEVWKCSKICQLYIHKSKLHFVHSLYIHQANDMYQIGRKAKLRKRDNYFQFSYWVLKLFWFFVIIGRNVYD